MSIFSWQKVINNKKMIENKSKPISCSAKGLESSSDGRQRCQKSRMLHVESQCRDWDESGSFSHARCSMTILGRRL